MKAQPATLELSSEHQGLLHFLYQLPVAVLRVDADGDIDMMNPRAASLLQSMGLPAAGPAAGRAVLQALHAPAAELIRSAASTLGALVERQPVAFADDTGSTWQLALSMHAVAPERWMVTLEDVTELSRVTNALRVSEHRFADLMEVIPAGVVIHGAGSEIRHANAEASRILGLSRAQLMGRDAIDPYWQFQHDDGRPMALAEFPVNRVLATGEAVSDLVIGVRQPGRTDLVWVIANAIPVRGEQGELREVCVSFTDISALKQAEQDLRVSDERYRLVLKGSNDAPWDWDLAKNTIYYSPRWWEIIGREPQAEFADPSFWLSLTHPDDRERVMAVIRQAIAEGPDAFEMEFRFLDPQGAVVDVLARGFVLRDDSGRAVRISGTTLDLRERKRAEAEIHRLAYTDPLTGLPNRRRLLEKAQEALATSARTLWHGALLFIDLDRFKELNDTRGHDSGDELLTCIAERLRECTRESDLVARLGGDEFVILVEHLGEDAQAAAVDAERIGQKCLAALATPIELRTGSHHAAASLGVALFGPDTQSVEQLLKQGDLAMYRAKALGGGCLHFFDQSMQAAMEQRVALGADLRKALRDGQLELHYQPQIASGEGIVGVEALLRWRHAERGWVSPAEFIPLAETTGMIHAVGHWLLETACCQLVRWAQSPSTAGLTVAVNISVHQIHDAGFVDEVRSVIEASGIDPRRLKLELTESALAQDVDQVIAKMNALRAMGVSWSLDDFGTGYSSLSYLKRLPLDQLKIDGSFVRDVITDASDATLVRTIIGLAREFGIEVIAEGVETEAQLNFLLQAGCARFQGYFFSRPETAETLDARMPALRELLR